MFHEVIVWAAYILALICSLMFLHHNTNIFLIYCKKKKNKEKGGSLPVLNITIRSHPFFSKNLTFSIWISRESNAEVELVVFLKMIILGYRLGEINFLESNKECFPRGSRHAGQSLLTLSCPEPGP